MPGVAPCQRGADQRYQEYKIVTFYDDTQQHRPVSVTRGGLRAGRSATRRDAGRVRLDQAGDQVAV
jgi:hypothetical protein